ncbi:hypothetical protein Dfri01_59240 [Dyadobacter frigoris]|nr:hypothetical protein Dfri01_59240 [Dyadobacter frigoris]
MQYEKLQTLSTPNFDTFSIVKAYTGGIVGTPSQQTTGSGPGWMTVLTGVWTDQHAVISNDTSNKVQAKTVFQYLKEYKPDLKTTSIATWSSIHDFLDKQMSYVDRRLDGGTDEAANTKVLNELENSDPDFMFVHYSDPDVIGHNVGYGEKYDRSILTMDAYLGKIMAVINSRTKAKNEEWLVILTTDHGRRGDGHHHGSQTIEEKTVFVGMNIAGNAEFNTTFTEVPNQDFNGIYKHIPQTSIIPTILTYLNIKINSDWQLSSPSLIGKLGPRRVMISAKEDALYWYSNESGKASIYKDKQLLATVPARQRAYSLTEPLDKHRHIYTVTINGQSGSVTRKNFRINAATTWNDNKRALFLFNDNTYTFYDKINNKPDPEYPKALSTGAFPGCQDYMDKVEALINWDNTRIFMFLNDGKYILYNLNKNRIENGYPKDISNSSWPGLEPYKNEIIGAVKMDETRLYFFTRDGRFIVFDMNKNKTETTYALSINEKVLPGLKPYSSKVSATMDWSAEFFYVFLKDNSYLKYDKLNNKALDGYPMPINNTTWPNLVNR